MNALLPVAAIALATLAISGCDTNRSDADYGRSVQQMVQAQTYDPAAASNPPELAPETADAARLKNALDVYRKDVAKGSTKVEEAVEFDVAQ